MKRIFSIALALVAFAALAQVNVVVKNGLLVLDSNDLAVTKRIEWTPAYIETVAWYDAADAGTVNETGGAVSQWDDKSGNEYDLVQLSGGNQPNYWTKTQNGLNVIDFDGIDDFVSYSAGIITEQPFMFACVQVCDVTLDDDTVFDSHQTVRALFRRRASGYPAIYAGNSSTFLNSGVTIGAEAFMASGVFNNNSSTLLVNGGNEAGGVVLGTGYLNGITVGESQEGTRRFNGPICEIVIVGGAEDTDLRQKIEGYLAWKWGLVDNLPANHPYKTERPYR